MGKKRIVSVIIVLLMILSSFSVNAAVNSDGNQPSQPDNPVETGVFAGGSGTEDDPYLIENVEQLNEINNDLSANYKLISDIDMTGVSFTPIGDNKPDYINQNNDFDSFTGTFDGNGYIISNFKLVNSKTNRQAYIGALFTFMDNATVKDLELKDINFDITVLKNNYCGIGGIAVYASNCTFKDITISGNIKTLANNMNVGGLCSHISGCTFNHITSNVTIKGNAGGLIGYAVHGASFSNCVNNGSITGGYAGIVGVLNANMDNNTEYVFNNCSNNGKITGENAVAGIATINSTPTPVIKMNGCFNTGVITSSNADTPWGNSYGPGAAGLVYSVEDPLFAGEIIDCHNTGNITAKYLASGLITNISKKYGSDSINVLNSYNTGNVVCTGEKKKSYASGILFGSYDGALIENCYNTGIIDGTKSSGIVCELYSDIVSKCYNSGSIVNSSGVNGVSGGIVAENYSEIVNCYNNGSIQNYNCGGIAGYSRENSIIDKCYNIGAVNASNLGGAICSTSAATINDNYYFNGTANSVAKSSNKASDNSVALSNEQLTQQASYPGLDFGTKDTLSKKTAKAASVWEMSEYSKMPKLTGMKEVYVKSIALSSYPKTYTVNKSIPKSKVKIKVTYSNGKKATINAGFKFKTYSKKLGKRKITVYYAGKSLSFYTTFVPAQVSKVTLKPGKKKVTIKIKKAAGAKKYQIYRSTKSKKGYKLIKTVASTKYVNKKLKSKKVYYFKVRAINGKYKGPFSKVYKVKVK